MKLRAMLLLAVGTILGAGAVSGFAPVAHAGTAALPAGATTAGSPLIHSGCSAADFLGDQRLGPILLPAFGLLGRVLHDYQRTGGLPVPVFLSRFWRTLGARPGWIYPPANGFVIGPAGRPEETPTPLSPQQDIDRFGSEHGAFLSPEGTPFGHRALPPQNLDGTPAWACNYHDYEVIRRFAVQAGPAAAWFGQPGGGLQYQLDPALIPGAPRTLDVGWLLRHRYLAPVSPFAPVRGATR
jgi:Tuberculosis necrotizing toxin